MCPQSSSVHISLKISNYAKVTSTTKKQSLDYLLVKVKLVNSKRKEINNKRI